MTVNPYFKGMPLFDTESQKRYKIDKWLLTYYTPLINSVIWPIEVCLRQ